jgi:hypothetical protein
MRIEEAVPAGGVSSFSVSAWVERALERQKRTRRARRGKKIPEVLGPFLPFWSVFALKLPQLINSSSRMH